MQSRVCHQSTPLSLGELWLVTPLSGFQWVCLCITGVLSGGTDHPGSPGTEGLPGHGASSACLNGTWVRWSTQGYYPFQRAPVRTKRNCLVLSNYARVIPGAELKWKVTCGWKILADGFIKISSAWEGGGSPDHIPSSGLGWASPHSLSEGHSPVCGRQGSTGRFPGALSALPWLCAI